MNAASIHFSNKIMQSYKEAMKPLTRKYNISPTMADIILFLANNPQYKLAKDIVEVRAIKANLVSMNLERMEKEGFATIEISQTDRREKKITLTNKTKEIIAEGRKLQAVFFDQLFADIDKDDLDNFFSVFARIEQNAEKNDPA